MPAPTSGKVVLILSACVLLAGVGVWLAGGLDGRQPADADMAPPAAGPVAEEAAAPPQPQPAARSGDREAPGAAMQAGSVVSTHGEWRVVCDTPEEGDGEQCALIQNVIDGERPDVEILVVLLRSADRSSEILRVVVPINVLLRPGLGLYVDDANVGNVPFHQCLPDGCYAEAILEEPLLGMLRNGDEATFIFFQTPEEGIGVPVDLAGFAEGFDALP